MPDMSALATDAFKTLVGYNYTVKLYDDKGMSVIEPDKARLMVAQSPNLILTLVDADDDSCIKLLFGKSTHANDIAPLIQTLRTLAPKYNMTFQPKQHGTEIEPKNYRALAAVSESLKENNMRLCEGFYGTSRSSYLQLPHAKLVVHHADRIDPRRPDGRAQKIGAIFVENATGQRVRFPTNDLAKARRLAEHLNSGGNLHDRVSRKLMTVADRGPAALAENNAEVRSFLAWMDGFAPEKALRESDGLMGPVSDNAETDIIQNFDAHDFMISDEAENVIPSGMEGDNEISKRDLMDALKTYIRNYLELHDPNASADLHDDSALSDLADAVYEKAATAIAEDGYVIHDDMTEADDDLMPPEDDYLGDDLPPESQQQLLDCTITREDILMPNDDQGASLAREVGKSVVHPDPANPDDVELPSISDVQRLKTLAGMRDGKPY